MQLECACLCHQASHARTSRGSGKASQATACGTAYPLWESCIRDKIAGKKKATKKRRAHLGINDNCLSAYTTDCLGALQKHPVTQELTVLHQAGRPCCLGTGSVLWQSPRSCKDDIRILLLKFRGGNILCPVFILAHPKLCAQWNLGLKHCGVYLGSRAALSHLRIRGGGGGGGGQEGKSKLAMA